MKTIVLCGGRRCCPTVSILDDENILIDDDWGNQIRVTKEDIKELVNQYERGEI